LRRDTSMACTKIYRLSFAKYIRNRGQY